MASRLDSWPGFHVSLWRASGVGTSGHSATRELALLAVLSVDRIFFLTSAYLGYRYGSTDQSEVYLAVILTNVFNMALDIMIFILPIPLLFQSDTQRNTRIGLLALFGIGIV